MAERNTAGQRRIRGEGGEGMNRVRETSSRGQCKRRERGYLEYQDDHDAVSKVFEASEVLAKHDENYMPPEVSEALKKSGKMPSTSYKDYQK